jgi:uncharacterized Zn-binding protein involved in type VI secretion
MLHSSKAMCGGVVYSVVELMVVRANHAPSWRHGESCICPGAASRVAVWALLVSVAIRTLTLGCS